MLFHRRFPIMPERFGVLATYNAERARGIAHLPAYKERMRKLQMEFNRWSYENGYPLHKES